MVQLGKSKAGLGRTGVSAFGLVHLIDTFDRKPEVGTLGKFAQTGKYACAFKSMSIL